MRRERGGQAQPPDPGGEPKGAAGGCRWKHVGAVVRSCAFKRGQEMGHEEGQVSRVPGGRAGAQMWSPALAGGSFSEDRAGRGHGGSLGCVERTRGGGSWLFHQHTEPELWFFREGMVGVINIPSRPGGL